MEMWYGQYHPSDEEDNPNWLPPVQEYRSPETMNALHQQRLNELEALTKKARTCLTCRYREMWCCNHPLIKGFDRQGPWHMDDWACDKEGIVMRLCGPERALWTPKLTIKLSIKEFFLTRWLRWKGEL